MVVVVAQCVVSAAAEEDARAILCNLADDGGLAHEHALARFAHVRTERMERDETHRERLDRVLHLEQLVFAKVVDAELCRCQMYELAIVELDAELLGEDAGQLTSARAILTADRDDEILFHSRFPLSKCKRFLFR